MKAKKKNNQAEPGLIDLDIIDLDKVPVESLLDSRQSVKPKAVSDDVNKSDSTPAVPDTEPEDDTLPVSHVKEENTSYLQTDESWASDSWSMDGEEEEELSPEESATEEDDDREEDDEPSHKGPGKFLRSGLLLHLGFLLLLFVLAFLIVNVIRNYGTKKNLDDYEGNYDREVLDSIMPLLNEENLNIVDDGKTTIVAFGNSPFADDRDSKDSLANIIEDMTGATVYNCSVANSYLAAEGVTLSKEIAPLDAFNFYWLTTAFCLRNNEHVYQDIFDYLGEALPADGKEAYETLMEIDFNTVDVITIMYDGSDYLAGHYMYSDQNDTDIQQFTGNMCAGIDLIKATYPHIRIIVMSPTYAFAINESGQYVSSDQYRYGQDVLSTYVIKQFGYSYDREVTFVDNLYGTITEDTAPDYLIDNLHLNVDGRRKVAERFVYALDYYNDMNTETQE